MQNQVVRSTVRLEMSPIPFLYFVFRKGQQAGPSTAAQRYEDAMRHGSPAEKIREASRRTVRELFAFWILAILPIMLLLESRQMPEDKAALWAILFAAVLCLPCWLLYRLVRFAIGR